MTQREARGLLAVESSKERHGNFMGIDVKIDSQKWHWMMVFQLLDTKDKQLMAEYDKEMTKEDVELLAKQIFTQRTMKEFGGQLCFASKMTKFQFHELARKKIVEILCSFRNGLKLDTMESVDADEIFLLIELADTVTKQELADRQEIRVPIKPDVYATWVGHDEAPTSNTSPREESPHIGNPSTVQACPTLNYRNGHFDKDAKECPMHLRYVKDKADIFQDFREIDCIKIVRRRLREFFNVHELEAQQIIKKIQAVHKFEAIDYFHKTGWCDLSRMFRWPNARNVDSVRRYFGEEVGFFFHWLNFYTRYLMYPAMVGLLCFLGRFVFTDPSDVFISQGMQLLFAFLMMLWSTLFIARYTQRESLKCQQWGMKNYKTVASVRKQYLITDRHTWKEFRYRLYHQVAATLVMAETIAVVFFVSQFRARARALEEGETVFGMDGETADSMGKYMVTANIKIVDALWCLTSPNYAIKFENWRTDQELKDAMVRKIFMVKFVVYYYPFFYFAFLQEHLDGCGPSPDGCMETLSSNLRVFFGTHVATAVVMVLIPILKFRWDVHSEKAKARNSREFTFLHAQSKMAEYTSDTDDYMERVVLCGFLMMFSVALPLMATIVFLGNLLELKVLAFRMVYIMQRPNPRGQEGIGAWSEILKILAGMGVIVNVGMAVFSMQPLKELDMQNKFLIFMVAEHVVLLIVIIISRSIPQKTLTEINIAERDGDVVDDIMGNQSRQVRVISQKKFGYEVDDKMSIIIKEVADTTSKSIVATHRNVTDNQEGAHVNDSFALRPAHPDLHAAPGSHAARASPELHTAPASSELHTAPASAAEPKRQQQHTAPASSELHTAPASAAEPKRQQQQEQEPDPQPPPPKTKEKRAATPGAMHGFNRGDNVVVIGTINVRNTVVALPGDMAKVTGPSDQNDGKERVRVHFKARRDHSGADTNVLTSCIKLATPETATKEAAGSDTAA